MNEFTIAKYIFLMPLCLATLVGVIFLLKKFPKQTLVAVLCIAIFASPFIFLEGAAFARRFGLLTGFCMLLIFLASATCEEKDALASLPKFLFKMEFAACFFFNIFIGLLCGLISISELIEDRHELDLFFLWFLYFSLIQFLVPLGLYTVILIRFLLRKTAERGCK